MSPRQDLEFQRCHGVIVSKEWAGECRKNEIRSGCCEDSHSSVRERGGTLIRIR